MASWETINSQLSQSSVIIKYKIGTNGEMSSWEQIPAK